MEVLYKMIIKYCDACKKEIDNNICSFEPLFHIINDGGYVTTDEDNFMQPISGRILHYDLCLSCYNEVFKAAGNKFKEIRENYYTKTNKK
jgi:hypothetical protein